jgi:hypothetical protein
MLSFAKNMELCQVLPKIWSLVKFCQINGVMPSFAKNMELYQVFVKIMKICEVLPKNMELCPKP